MQQLYPAYRHGSVVYATKPPCHLNGSGPPAHTLDSKQARALGRLILRKHTDYVDALAESLGDDIANTVRVHTPSTNIRLAPGAIIDLPNFSFNDGGIETICRPCVTICHKQSRSKLWIRMLARRFDGREAIVADKEAEQPGSEPGRFEELKLHWFSQVPTWSQHMIDALQRSYSTDLSEIAGEPVELTQRHHFHFYSIDIDRLDFQDFAEDLIAEPDKKGLALNEDCSKQLMNIANIALGVDGPGSDIVGFLSRKSNMLLPHETADGRVGVYLTTASKDVMVFAGVAATPKRRTPSMEISQTDYGEEGAMSDFWRPSGSLNLTADLSNIYARMF